MRRRTFPAWRHAAGFVLVAVLAVAACSASGQGLLRGTAPDRLTDQEFWQLSTDFSEPGGTFHSENYISNENRFQTVIPELVTRVTPGGLYLGVGPEQNFTYIAATRPKMVFIVDIRRGNLLEHLLYKALMELSATRVEFVSRLFGRPMPSTMGAETTVSDLFDAAAAASPSDAMFQASLAAVLDRLTHGHGFALTDADRVQIEYIYRHAFFEDGPSMMYRRTDGFNAGRRPTYYELMTWDDGAGTQRSYLARETSFAFLKDLQTRNLLVPVVGDFGGPKALRAVGAYAGAHGLTVAAFYLSNVEQYLRQDGKDQAFCASVASMPLDASSTFIRSQSVGGGFYSLLGSMRDETRPCVGRRLQ